VLHDLRRLTEATFGESVSGLHAVAHRTRVGMEHSPTSATGTGWERTRGGGGAGGSVDGALHVQGLMLVLVIVAIALATFLRALDEGRLAPQRTAWEALSTAAKAVDYGSEPLNARAFSPFLVRQSG
jgi:hypothetical protein